jgi:hypothetical protein
MVPTTVGVVTASAAGVAAGAAGAAARKVTLGVGVTVSALGPDGDAEV